MKYLDLNALLANGPPGRDWGPWALEPDLRVLVIHTGRTGGYRYEIDLDGCTSSAAVLDWICQIANKAWCDDETLAGLVRAFLDILHPQRLLCSRGADKRLTLERIVELVAVADQRRGGLTVTPTATTDPDRPDFLPERGPAYHPLPVFFIR